MNRQPVYVPESNDFVGSHGIMEWNALMEKGDAL